MKKYSKRIKIETIKTQFEWKSWYEKYEIYSLFSFLSLSLSHSLTSLSLSFSFYSWKQWKFNLSYTILLVHACPPPPPLLLLLPSSLHFTWHKKRSYCSLRKRKRFFFSVFLSFWLLKFPIFLLDLFWQARWIYFWWYQNTWKREAKQIARCCWMGIFLFLSAADFVYTFPTCECEWFCFPHKQPTNDKLSTKYKDFVVDWLDNYFNQGEEKSW